MLDGDFASFEPKIDDRQAGRLAGGASELYFSSVPIRFPNALLQCTRQQWQMSSTSHEVGNNLTLLNVLCPKINNRGAQVGRQPTVDFACVNQI